MHLSANDIYQGDCLELMNGIPDKSIDMILCDLPYGTTECDWDKHIDIKRLWNQYNRVLKDTGNIVLFASQPFTTKLIESNLAQFRYELIWVKSRQTGFANANHRHMKKHENILIFTKSSTSTAGDTHAKFNPQGLIEKERRIKRTSRGYQGERQNSSDDYISKYTNYPHSILEYASEGSTIHPTQKPVDLCEYLIRTYTDDGDLVLDNCMGSGSTAISAINTGRNYIGIELDKDYYNVAQNRIREHIEDLQI